MNNILYTAKHLSAAHNVIFRVLDARTYQVIQEVVGHNAATNSMLTGVGQYLIGSGVFNQNPQALSMYIPRYISLGTLGLYSQQANPDTGLPLGLGDESTEDKGERYADYLLHCPGFGADGYDPNSNNNRAVFGLGPMWDPNVDNLKDEAGAAIQCELITPEFQRALISYREVVPEYQAEVANTIDVVFSALISVGALSRFRGTRDHIFITEAGLWSQKTWNDSGANGLLAGYRLAPADKSNWAMTTASVAKQHGRETPTPEDEAEAIANQLELEKSILRVGKGQVVQVIWKVQLGSIEELAGIGADLYNQVPVLYWTVTD